MSNKLNDINEIPWQVKRFNDLINQEQSIYFDVDDFEEIIDHYVIIGDYLKAQQISGYALKVHPGSVPLMLRGAQLLASANKEERALDILKDIEALEPDNSDVFLTKGAIYSQLRHYEKAIEEFNKAISNADEPDYIYCNIAFEYENMGNFDKTLEYLTKALDLNPENDLAIYEAAYCFDLLSLTEESISFFSKLIDRHPYSVEAWFNLGVSYINAELYEKACESFDFAIAIEPDHTPTWFHLGYALSLNEKFSEAIEAYKNSLENDEGDAMKYYYIGECYEKSEDYVNARIYYKKATGLQVDIPDAWIGMGVCEHELGNAKKAMDYLNKGVNLDPDNTGYLCIIADIHMAQDNIGEGAAFFQKAIESSPEEETVRIDYADAMAEKKELEESVNIIQSALDKFSSNAALYYRMAAYLYLLSKSKEASYFFEEALMMDFEKHNSVFDQFPELKTNPDILMLIDMYAK